MDIKTVARAHRQRHQANEDEDEEIFDDLTPAFDKWLKRSGEKDKELLEIVKAKCGLFKYTWSETKYEPDQLWTVFELVKKIKDDVKRYDNIQKEKEVYDKIGINEDELKRLKKNKDFDEQLQKDFPRYDDFWMNPLCYKYPDHSGGVLIIGARRQGKTKMGYWVGYKVCVQYDPERAFAFYKIPDADEKKRYLESIGFKHIYICDTIGDIPNNCVVFGDEGMRTFNGKNANTKSARQFDGFSSILSQKRLILIVTFQRWEVYASLEEMSELRCYKKLGTFLLNRAGREDAFLKAHKTAINSLSKEQALIESELDGFEGTGVVFVEKPKWYTRILSEGSKNADADSEVEDYKRFMQMKSDIALDMLKHGYRPDPTHKKLYFALVSRINYLNLEKRFSGKDINDIIMRMYEIMYYEPQMLIGSGMSKEDYEELIHQPKVEDIDQNDIEMGRQWGEGKASDDFDMNKRSAIEKIKRVMLYLVGEHFTKSLADKEGNKGERLLANYFLDKGDYVIRALASGGYRGGCKYPQPDFLHFLSNGEIRAVQVKTRSDYIESFKPGTFDAELETVQLLNNNPFLKEKVKPYLYYLPKGENVENVYMIELKPEYNTKSMSVDFTHKTFSLYEHPEKDKGDKRAEEKDSSEKTKVEKTKITKIKGEKIKQPKEVKIKK